MEKIFSKTSFPKVPGGNLYEWKEAKTAFHIDERGLFAIKIDASAKNAQQNRSKDDDDLRMALDGFDFGKYEHNQEMVSWKGFGTSASWDGASLKGGTKSVYFFVELEAGFHMLQFFADETPTLKGIEIFKLENNTFELKKLKPSEKIKNARKGIPWISFVFLGAQAKIFTLAVETKSAKRKGHTDGDNLKVVVNGKIQKNPHASESYKYKNFYFSGDIKEFDIFSAASKDLNDPLAFENAIELWYDEEPEISDLAIEYFDNKEFLERLKDFVDLRKYVLNRAHLTINVFKLTKNKYAAQFLEHALEKNPKALVFQMGDPLIGKIRRDPAYEKIIAQLKKKISSGILNGEIWPDDFDDRHIDLNSDDLKYALHGIKKIEYTASMFRRNTYKIIMTLFDIYDFSGINVPKSFWPVSDFLKAIVINELDRGETIGIIRNYEIEIHIDEIISIH